MPATATQSEAVVTTGPREFSEDRWLNVPNKPVFSEHTTKDREGRPVVYDRRALELMVAACNRRIAETGDYAAISIGHTPDMDQQAQGMPMPLVVGLAGPYRVGRLGQTGRYAIFADLHFQRDKLSEVKGVSRVSPEVWLTERMEDRILDPIALLKAETPRLDMGFLQVYCRTSAGEVVEKYTAAMPSGTNTFIPTEKYEQETTMLSPEDVGQIVEAVSNTDWAKWCKAQMAAEQGPEPSVPGAPPAAPAVPGNPAAPPPAPPKDDAEKNRATYQAPEKPDDEVDKLSRDERRLEKARYQKMESDLAALNQKFAQSEERRINSERYSKIMELRQLKAFDEKKIVEKAKYGRMSDEQFQDTLDLIAETAQPIPLGVGLYAPDLPAQRDAVEADKYARETSEEATRMAEREGIDFEVALEKVRAARKAS